MMNDYPSLPTVAVEKILWSRLKRGFTVFQLCYFGERAVEFA